MLNKPIIEAYGASLLGKSPSTKYSYLAVVKRFLASLPEDLLPEDLVPQHAQAFIQGLQDNPNFNDLSIRAYLSAVRGFLAWWASTGAIAAAVGEVLPTTWRAPRPVPVVATEEEVNKLIAATAGPKWLRFRLVVLLAAQAGLRRAEIANLEWSGVDFDNDPPTISFVGKGNKRRTLPIFTQGLYDALTEWRARAEGLGADSRYLFPQRGNKDKAVAVDSVAKWLAGACYLAAIRHLGPHALRHAFAHSASRRGVTVTAMQAALGHSSLGVTERYLTGMDSVTELSEAFSGRVG
jgi:integrase/recombinase XerC